MSIGAVTRLKYHFRAQDAAQLCFENSLICPSTEGKRIRLGSRSSVLNEERELGRTRLAGEAAPHPVIASSCFMKQ